MKRVSIIIAAFLFMAVQMNGQSVPFLNINSDPYSHSMGGATLTLEQNAFTAANNASAMVFAPNKVYGGLSYNTWQPDFLNNTNMGIATFSKVGKWAWGVSAKIFGYESYKITNDKGGISDTYTPKESSFDTILTFSVTFLSIPFPFSTWDSWSFPDVEKSVERDRNPCRELACRPK